MKHRIQSIFLMALFTLLNVVAKAQCAMCTASAENSLEEGSTAAKGLNTGILYLFALIFIFPIAFYLIYRNRKKFLDKFNEQ